MNRYKKITTSLLALAFVFGVTGCEKKDEAVIKIGATVGPHAQVVQAVAKEAAKQGINIELVEFSDYITPNAALDDGSIQLNSYQHQPFLDNFNANHDSKLVSIGRSILMRMGVYSNKYTSLDSIPDNARIAIPNDPTNGGRGLLLLEDAGMISLKDNVGFNASLSDIVDNPKNIRFVEMDAAQLPRSLDDVDAAAITMNYVMSAGLDPKKQGIYLEKKDASLAVMVVAAREEDKNNETYKKIISIYHSQEINDFLNTTFKGTIEAAN
ncbi:MetQ/NlpA family ABC transporter substrate-binding protein [Vibrio lentus]|uniref:Lipoprotein n=1 Tax=Vibrio lentus TaxID=136468 RepID=A0A4U2EQZ6_9VIBR|nr:MetQ/NlpA family ABC transporter substrate-binding protein [Vibrio lentus]MCC4782876.1 MetQ/NlpA family ABC transporter substrate-binding protein [Vibrio lentus]PME57449.1 methionine ABC transporter substrate-binding protein [Vibrio lentus]PMG59412.1 methionine ABC transporter substrate-binding protein [Vibrio lentus]PMI95626.1 methionine ABC transporter substrate-binding protein [Vibrio lentus]PMJ05374.1 methionine ABC transporter substrate-binding protein [Vibrio lentus]